MHCAHCVQSVTDSLNRIDGVSAKVDLNKNCAEISLDREVGDDLLIAAVEKEGFSGMARWMRKQSAEETGHACAIAEYMAKREAEAKVDKVDVVPQGWGSPTEVFEHALEHERHVSRLIDELVHLASEEKDNATRDFLWGFVREQVEEEANFLNIVNLMKKAGESGILFMDAKLGERQS